ncbi:hypothetical protein IW140_001182 [Coemansia sp. RSA 1813]|nr:hypothetical protein EV178_004949 [Coemansia sp. RSA 1646]KAJ1770002.1 hypothetical protein LPJ74_003576 [Coemansia sp. RSA 1843]KAJ2092089.1 hypothetical protein IW138_001455 [Coemansia sp. RSA 986]KAJ2216575.1 hypothetical protein EV179_001114 [Coemansia sp. RSA 487]KAJ2572142.1 hypothetical protein IW140_001182 [Coemansia sp. RSA 1813]
MLASNTEFLKALPSLFTETKESGSVSVTIKRYDYQGTKQQREERKKKRLAQSKNDEAMHLLVDSLSLDDKEYATLVRAVTPKKKLSTLVAPADLDAFLARYHGLLLVSVDTIKKNERLRKKKAATKRLAARKARAATEKTKQKKLKSDQKTA